MAAARLAAALAAGTLIVAAGHVGLFVAAGVVPASDAIVGIARSWIGDLNGALTLTPLLLHAAAPRRYLHAVRARSLEVLVQLAAVVALLWVVFLLPAADQLRFFYLLFVPIVWVALRWSWPGAMLAVLALQLGLLVAAESHVATARFIDLQFLMLTLSLTALLLGAVVAERAEVLRRVAMREAEQRALLAMAPDAVLAVDDHGTIRVANAAAVRLFGEPAVSRDSSGLRELLPGLRLDPQGGRAVLDGRRRDGGIFPAEIAWARLESPVDDGYLVTVRDATEGRRAQEQLRARDAALARAMRFAVAGELASALAHELNQPITALVSYLEASQILAERTAGADDRLKGTLGKAAQEATRASQVLHRLRDFYQGGTLRKETVHLASICAAVTGAFEDRLRRTEATLTVAVDPGLPALQSDGTQLEVVIHNLLANALDAVADVSKPRRLIRVTAECADGVMLLRVEDSGPGIPAEVAGWLFEPFVTSKPDGMGLGLAISRSLIRALGGELSYAPARELGGASFCVRLPLDAATAGPAV